MARESEPGNPRQEYAAVLRAVAAHLELEQSFGIESWSLPAPPAAASAARPGPKAGAAPPSRGTPGAAGPMKPAQPAPPEHPAPASEPPRRVATESKRELFGAKPYEIQIPEGLSKPEQLDHLRKAMEACCICPLRKSARQIVFGVGSPDADLMFIGEAPGHDEDVQGLPFVGRAGQLLTKIIEAMGLTRDEVYIANICKCRPPENRAPTPEEMEACRPYLMRQIDVIKPNIIVLLGATAVRGLLQTKEGISKVRGQFLAWHGIQVMATYHPAYLLRDPSEKRKVWEDMQKVRDALRRMKSHG